ncbi:MAG: hypothetical protein HY821_20765 [Acidobacteria bacterium]|nr:hypothetical protein [Acidobacteriota bacterium]
MTRNLLLAVVTLLALAAGALAADVTGTWVAQVPGRDGNMMETTFVLKQAGESLTGSMENQFGQREISDGKVSGDDLTFNVYIEFNGNKMTLAFTGKAAGSEIKFKRERKGGDAGPSNAEFVAKKK